MGRRREPRDNTAKKCKRRRAEHAGVAGSVTSGRGRRRLCLFVVTAFLHRLHALFAALGALGGALYELGADQLDNGLFGAIALIASLLVTTAYHLGYPEYRSANGVMGPSIGNGVMSFGYILTNNPISAVFSHIAMHIAGVFQGPASVMQLPPHY